jgi:uncharacterized membrane protein YeiH
MDVPTLVGLADLIGIVAFAVSGVAVGLRRRMDLYGLIALGVTTAIGGGVVRDLLLSEVPRALVRADYLLFAVGASGLAIVAAALGWRWPDPVLGAADALGTGAFAVTGALLGREAGVAWPAIAVLAVLTATGGGVLRDLLANRVPVVLRTELNATAAAAGGLAAYALDGAIEASAAVLMGATLAAALSGAGRAGLGRLPRLGPR